MLRDLESPDFELRWPGDLLVDEIEAVLQNNGASENIAFLLSEAFAGNQPVDVWRDGGWDELLGGRTDRRAAFLSELVQAIRDGTLRTATERAPRWKQRTRSDAAGTLDGDAVRRKFAAFATNLIDTGYLDRVAPRDCVDAPSPGPTIQEFLRDELSCNVWPLTTHAPQLDDDTFYELIELLHDACARPRARYWHDFAQCGWHYSDFSMNAGRRLYRWHVNQILARSSIELRLADSGEDVGRLVALTDDARAALVSRARASSDAKRAQTIDHAVALFRDRAATVESKRSAVVALAGLLEERRPLLRTELMSKDEGALFQIANSFALRHRNASQQGDYDPVFIDWIFWWYLATVELTDRLIDRPS